MEAFLKKNNLSISNFIQSTCTQNNKNKQREEKKRNDRRNSWRGHDPDHKTERNTGRNSYRRTSSRDAYGREYTELLKITLKDVPNDYKYRYYTFEEVKRIVGTREKYNRLNDARIR